LYDFDIKKDAVPLDKMKVIDQYALQELFEVHYKVLKAYAEYDFTAVFHAISDYCSVNLSAFYLDIIKDRLYVDLAHGQERRSAQTACWYIVDTLTKLMAPILSFTAEQVSDHYQKDKKESIHLQKFNTLQSIWEILAKKYATLRVIEEQGYVPGVFETIANIDEQLFRSQLEERWDIIKKIRSALLKAIEEQREKGIIKHSLEAQVKVLFDPKAPWIDQLHTLFKELDGKKEHVENFFKEFLIISRFDNVHQASADMQESELKGMLVVVSHAPGKKCPRCWQWTETQHEHDLCDRCTGVLKEMKK
jgi:isoleucyl-tRNA synthetase